MTTGSNLQLNSRHRRQVLGKTAIQFRHTRDLKTESVWMKIYHGGVSPSPQNMALYLDNVVIARRYIGPDKR